MKDMILDVTTVCALAGALVLVVAYPQQQNAALDARQVATIAQIKADARKERAARELCIKTTGPRSEPVWDADGVLVCVTHRGMPVRGGQSS